MLCALRSLACGRYLNIGKLRDDQAETWRKSKRKSHSLPFKELLLGLSVRRLLSMFRSIHQHVSLAIVGAKVRVPGDKQHLVSCMSGVMLSCISVQSSNTKVDKNQTLTFSFSN